MVSSTYTYLISLIIGGKLIGDLLLDLGSLASVLGLLFDLFLLLFGDLEGLQDPVELPVHGLHFVECNAFLHISVWEQSGL